RVLFRSRLDFAFIKLLAQLTCTHNGDGHFQVPDFATVEVRSRQGDVAQRAGTEHIFVRCRRGNSEATFVVRGKNIRTRTLDYPKREIALPAYVDARRSEEHTSELQSRENLVCRL